jgi:hypothetical protein
MLGRRGRGVGRGLGAAFLRRGLRRGGRCRGQGLGVRHGRQKRPAEREHGEGLGHDVRIPVPESG